MTYLYSIKDLVPCPLSDVPVGAVFSMLDAGQTLYVRTDAPSSVGGGTFMALDSALTVANVVAANMQKKAQCLPPGELRISADGIGARVTNLQPGQISLSEDGPVLGAQGLDYMGFKTELYLSMASWQFIDYPAKTWRVDAGKLVWVPADPAQSPVVLLSF